MKTTTMLALCLFISTLVPGQTQDVEKNPREKVIQLTTVTTENPPAISLRWNPVPGKFNIEIFRKNKDAVNWGTAIAVLPNTATEYSDENVKTGMEYEYAIKAKWYIPIETYVSAGIKCKEVESRGKIIFLVDSTFTTDLQNELKLFESDLIGDGWEVLRKDISRNASVKNVKSVIVDLYNSDPVKVNSVFLFGHIPVPYSGTKAYDGHITEHDGAWPTDLYYGDLNENIWTDKIVNCTTANRCENKNVPGDGKFDVCELPNNEIVSLAVGRVDFYNMTDFPQSEAELLRNYLVKNHAFRHKMINPEMKALVDDNWGIICNQGVTEAFAVSGWRNFSALLNFQNIKTGKFFSETENESYIWAYACGGGLFDSCKYVGSTKSFVHQNPKAVFTALYGSRFGDWDSENNFMRAALASNGWILTCCWAGRPQYTFHQMGMGATTGECVKATQNNKNTYYAGCTNRGIHVGLLGDPTLRMHIVRPVSNLKSAVTGSQTIRLSWDQSEDDVIGYYVYKLDTTSNRYLKISESPVTETYFEDKLPEAGNNYYMVRTLKLSKVVSGSYFNLSQGIFDTIRFEQQAIPFSEITSSTEVAENKPLIYPNPSNGYFNISFGSNVNAATIQIFDLNGKLLREKTFQNTSLERFDISTLPKGMYMVISITDNKKTVTKICLQ